MLNNKNYLSTKSKKYLQGLKVDIGLIFKSITMIIISVPIALVTTLKLQDNCNKFIKTIPTNHRRFIQPIIPKKPDDNIFYLIIINIINFITSLANVLINAVSKIIYLITEFTFKHGFGMFCGWNIVYMMVLDLPVTITVVLAAALIGITIQILANIAEKNTAFNVFVIALGITSMGSIISACSQTPILAIFASNNVSIILTILSLALITILPCVIRRVIDYNFTEPNKQNIRGVASGSMRQPQGTTKPTTGKNQEAAEYNSSHSMG